MHLRLSYLEQKVHKAKRPLWSKNDPGPPVESSPNWTSYPQHYIALLIFAQENKETQGHAIIKGGKEMAKSCEISQICFSQALKKYIYHHLFQKPPIVEHV